MTLSSTLASDDEPAVDIDVEIEGELQPLARFAGYEVLGRLAVGGMAEVFLARERGEGGSARQIALKVIRGARGSRPDLAALFVQEGRVAMGLAHPNVCHTLRFGTEHGHPFLAMELVLGITLRDVFARARRAGTTLAPAIAAKIASHVAEALHSAHVARDERGTRLGLVHQDVSPQNVMVAWDGTVKLLDFGVASTSNDRASEAVESSHVTVRGKTAYLSPEQCSGLVPDARSDVFGLGVVLYEVLTGTRLFARRSTEESMRAIAAEPLPSLPSTIPAPLRRVLARALAHDRDDRYESAAAMQEDLERYLVDGRTVVTSARIAAELERVLGAEFGRAPEIDRTPEATRWLRAESETVVLELPAAIDLAIPLTQRRRVRRKRASGLAATLGMIAIVSVTSFATRTTSVPVPISAPVPEATPAPSPTPSPSPSPSPATSTPPSPSLSPIAPLPDPLSFGEREPVRRRHARVHATAPVTTTTEATPAEPELVDDPGY